MPTNAPTQTTPAGGLPSNSTMEEAFCKCPFIRLARKFLDAMIKAFWKSLPYIIAGLVIGWLKFVSDAR